MSIKEKYNLTDQQVSNVINTVSDVTGVPQEKIAVSFADVGKKITGLGKSVGKRLGNMSDAEKAVFYPVAAGVGSAAVSYGVPASIEALKGAKIRRNKKKYLKEMQRVHPELRNMDKDSMDIAYNSIAMHTPDVLKDPLLGGQTLKQFAKYRMADVSQLNEISRLRGTRPLDQAMFNATDALSRGVREGIGGINVERIRQEDGRYREKMDQQRADMDRLRLAQGEQAQKLREEQFKYQQDVLDPYQRDKDALQAAQKEVDLELKQRGMDQQLWMFKEKLPYDAQQVFYNSETNTPHAYTKEPKHYADQFQRTKQKSFDAGDIAERIKKKAKK